MRARVLVGLALTAVATGCRPSPTPLSPARARWLGCYTVSWRPDSVRSDSIRLTRGRPPHLQHASGFRPAYFYNPLPLWPDTANAHPTADWSYQVPWWTTRFDSLVVSEGSLSGTEYTIWAQGAGLAGTVRYWSDVLGWVEDSSGRPHIKPAEEYQAVVARVRCPDSGPPN